MSAIAAPNERERLETLHRYDILDTPPAPEFDDLARLAADVCATPMALVSFVAADRQWFKARIGLAVEGTARDVSFCAHAIQQPNVFVVPDTLRDDRFAGNPLVVGPPHARFYAGAPLTTPDGYALGTICVIDAVPRELSIAQEASLRALARHVVAQLE
ncbi:MAG: GAF domain-containing protein, partial [Acidobacteriota bacterium]